MTGNTPRPNGEVEPVTAILAVSRSAFALGSHRETTGLER
jgi:hypothetical protein